MQTKKSLILVILLKKKTDFNAKISEIENKIPDINGLTAVENKIPQVSNLVKKTDYDTKY